MALTKVANTLLDFTGGFVAGNVSFPAITTVGDTNTGIYFPAADTIAFAEGGAEVARFDSSGNFGLGVTPSAWGSISRALQFQSGVSVFSNTSGLGGVGNNVYSNPGTGDFYIANGYATRYYQFNGAHVWNTAASGTAGNAITFTQVLSVDKAKSLALEGATSQTGTGITFPATQSASTDANTLDDYEEGTFTPTIANFTVSGTTTLTGAYTKIGRMVFVSIKFENTGTIAHSTSAFITLPFAIPTGALPTGGIVMYVNNNSESFTSGKNGTQHALDTEGGARFFPGSFTTTSAGQHLFFSGFYRTS